MNLLIIEDDQVLGKALQKGLDEAGNLCHWCRQGSTGLEHALSQQYDLYEGMRSEFNSFLKALSQQYVEIGNTLVNPSGPLAASNKPEEKALDEEKKQLRAAVNAPKQWSKITVKAAPAPNASDGAEPMFAGRNGALYLQRIQDQLAKTKQSLSQITGVETQIKQNIANLNKTNDNGDNKGGKDGPAAASGGSGLDMKSLAALATAGAGLAGVMNKQNQQATSSGEDAAT